MWPMNIMAMKLCGSNEMASIVLIMAYSILIQWRRRDGVLMTMLKVVFNIIALLIREI
jgi:uncharacterized membrane-anchored protein